MKEGTEVKKMSLRTRIMRKLGTTRILALSFLLVILSGTLLLLLPCFSLNGKPLSFLDSLFIATSATCVTGLVPAALASQYNLGGLTVILCLIQIGGLGLMSLIAFVLILLKRRLHHSEKQMIQDALNKKDLQDVPHFLKQIIRCTFLFEGLGALFLLIRFVPQFGLARGVYHAVFLSISAFCNAGMDSFSAVSLMDYAADPLVNLIIALLIIIGGLGFAVWFDLGRRIPEKFQKRMPFRSWKNTLSVHTRVVLIMTFGLIVGGMLLTLLVEWNNPATLGALSLAEKIEAAFFQSVTLRTAGFSTVDFSALRPASLFFMLGFMLIGGSPGGTAGGIKTTAIVMMFLIIRSQLANNEMTLFKRTIPKASFHRAFVVTITYIVILSAAIFVLTLSENADFLTLVFEAVSAIATVGLSAGLTPFLSPVGKAVIILLMFIGRVGPITIVMSMVKIKHMHKPSEIRYPEADILIG